MSAKKKSASTAGRDGLMEFWIKVLGVILVLEGIPWFLSPSGMKRYLRQMLATPEATLRGLGLMLMLAGLLAVYLAGG